MAQEPSFDLHDLYQRILLEAHATWRYRWHALVVTWCIAIAGTLLILKMPDQYESRAEVYADTSSLMNPLLKGLAVQPDVDRRLDIITHTLLSRPNLEKVVNETGLSLRATTPSDKDRLLGRLGSAVKIKGAGAKNLYNIHYTDRDPQMAQKVVQAFLQILMNDTLGVSSTSMQTAQSFLKQQVKDYGDQLDAADRKIADFKKANIAYLGASGTGDYFTRLQTAKAALAGLQAQYASVGTGAPATVAAAGPAPVDPRLQSLDQQIAAHQQKLDELLLSYTNQYPGVIAARHAITELKAQRASLEKTAGHAPRAVATSRSHSNTLSDSGTKAALAAQIALKQQQVTTLEQNVDTATDAQTQLQQLTRNYDLTKKLYDALVVRLNTAQLSQDASQSGNNLKFRVVSPPIAPVVAVGPKRMRLLVVAFVLALGIGVAFAYFMHKIRPVFTSLHNLREASPYPVLGALGLIEAGSILRRRYVTVLGFGAGLGLLAVLMGAALVFDANAAQLMHQLLGAGIT